MTGKTQQYNRRADDNNMFKGVIEKVIASTLASLLIAVVGFGIYINSAINTLSKNVEYSSLVVQNLVDKISRVENRMDTFEVDFNDSINTLSKNVGFSRIAVENLDEKISRVEDRVDTFEIDFVRRIEILEFAKRIEQEMELTLRESRRIMSFLQELLLSNEGKTNRLKEALENR